MGKRLRQSKNNSNYGGIIGVKETIVKLLQWLLFSWDWSNKLNDKK